MQLEKNMAIGHWMDYYRNVSSINDLIRFDKCVELNIQIGSMFFIIRKHKIDSRFVKSNRGMQFYPLNATNVVFFIASTQFYWTQASKIARKKNLKTNQ